MKLRKLGKNISDVEILNVSINGIWIHVRGQEFFLSFEHYPWFKNASIAEIHQVELLHDQHLRWPDLDVDLELASLDHPEKYPLMADSKPR
ncbi:MAG: DUF2442 domain-containing protein [Deltaproteobacteria bacterium]|nr:DUF2442 domain-containing protein [Deltaproteobacteria bacterium]